MKILAAIALAVASLAAAAAPADAQHGRAARSPAPHDMVAKVDDGYVQGLPTAPIKLTVISSFGCPHCADFDRDATAELRRDWIDTGKVQVHFVPFMLFPTDIPALILADCGDPKAFFHRADVLFARHDETQNRFRAMDPATSAQLQKADERTQTLGILHQSGLDQAYGALGLRPEQAKACLTDQTLRASLRARQKLAVARYQVKGTPTILIDGRPARPSWPTVRQALSAAR